MKARAEVIAQGHPLRPLDGGARHNAQAVPTLQHRLSGFAMVQYQLWLTVGGRSPALAR